MEIRKRWVIANPKMYGSLEKNIRLFRSIASTSIDGIEIGVCVSFPYLAQASGILSGSSMVWGTQDISMYKGGAYTGEVSAWMAREFGTTLTIVGHSERRRYFSESNAMITQKVVCALEAGITPIICVGETLKEREIGKTERIISQQLDSILTVLEKLDNVRIFIAYEPVWAIGGSKIANISEIKTVYELLHNIFKKSGIRNPIIILYGGSVNPCNVSQLLEIDEIDGFLVGRASMIENDFFAICQAVSLSKDF